MTEADKQRPKGFYWVKIHEWEIMRWDGKHWNDTDGDWYTGIKAMEIDERQIVRENDKSDNRTIL